LSYAGPVWRSFRRGCADLAAVETHDPQRRAGGMLVGAIHRSLSEELLVLGPVTNLRSFFAAVRPLRRH